MKLDSTMKRGCAEHMTGGGVTLPGHVSVICGSGAREQRGHRSAMSPADSCTLAGWRREV